jgi:hypothetical protein
MVVALPMPVDDVTEGDYELEVLGVEELNASVSFQRLCA